jgi:hypothetical protein
VGGEGPAMRITDRALMVLSRPWSPRSLHSTFRMMNVTHCLSSMSDDEPCDG